MNEPARDLPAPDTPAAALGPAWDLLDALPPAAAPPTMTSTTVEMAAAVGRPRAARGSWWRSGIGPVAVVVAAFAAGVVAGRTTVTDPDQMAFEYLPVIEHIDVLREAGSVEFLTAVARKNYPPPPRRPGFGRPGDRGTEPAPQSHEGLEAAMAAFAAAPNEPDSVAVATRRTSFAARPADERRRIFDAAAEFQRLSSAQRRELVQLARVLGGREGTGPDRDELLDAARLWHQWLATRDPAERRSVIDLGASERLEWLDRYARIWPGGRGGAFRDGGGFRGGPPPGPPPEGPPPEGAPPEGPRFNDRPPFDPRRGPPPRGETPGPPR